MNLASFVHDYINESPVAEWLRCSDPATYHCTAMGLPIVNALHVVALATVFGTILIADLRLLGLPATSRPYTKIAHETVGWTWAAFALAVVTGLLMFTDNADTYLITPAFWLKMGVLVLAGVNMAVFELITMRGVAAWDTGPTPTAARVAGAVSILLWTTVILLGRVIGFTKPRVFDVPEGLDLDFSWLSGLAHWS